MQQRQSRCSARIKYGKVGNTSGKYRRVIIYRHLRLICIGLCVGATPRAGSSTMVPHLAQASFLLARRSATEVVDTRAICLYRVNCMTNTLSRGHACSLISDRRNAPLQLPFCVCRIMCWDVAIVLWLRVATTRAPCDRANRFPGAGKLDK